MCALTRQYNLDIHPHECSARQGTSEALSLSRKNLIGTCTGATVFEQVLRPARLILHPGDPRPSASPRPGYGAAWPDTISCHDPVQPTPPLGLCRFLTVVGGAGKPSRAAVKPYTTRQLGSPGENARWGSGLDSPWRGGGGPPRLRAPTVAKHLVSAPPTSCHVSSPRLHARVASRAAPALAPPLPHHTRPPLSSARHLLPLALSRRRGLKTVDFWGRRKVRPGALPLPRPRSPFERLYGHCG